VTAKQQDPQYQSFLLRLWQEEETNGTAVWHGEIESIQSGRKWVFTSPEATLEFLGGVLWGQSAEEVDIEQEGN